MGCEVGERTLYFNLSQVAGDPHPFRLINVELHDGESRCVRVLSERGPRHTGSRQRATSGRMLNVD
jgi:hypothetical protein